MELNSKEMNELREKVLAHVKNSTMMPNAKDVARAIGGSFFDVTQALDGLLKEKLILKGPTGRYYINKNRSKGESEETYEPTCVRKDGTARMNPKPKFECAHCGRPFAYEKACRKHESNCPKNTNRPPEKVEEPLVEEVPDTSEVVMPVKVQAVSGEAAEVQALFDICRPPSAISGVTKRIGPFLVTVNQIGGA